MTSVASIPGTISRWLMLNNRTQADLAREMGVTRQFVSAVVTGSREIPDERIGDLPEPLRRDVATIRIHRYETLADLVRRVAGIRKG